MRAVAGIALAVLLAVASCGERIGEHGERPGDALEEVNRSRWIVPPRVAYAPGQELVFMVVPVRNVSDSPLVIRRVEPLRLVGSPRVARVVGIDLAPRKRGIGSPVPLGPYQTYPPASSSFGECSVQRVVRAAGYALKPSRNPADRALLVIRIRMRAPGTFRLKGERVVYEQDGEVYYQELPFSLRIAVRRGPGQPLREDERSCAHLTKVPGRVPGALPQPPPAPGP